MTNALMGVQVYNSNAISGAFDDIASAYLGDVLLYSHCEEAYVGHIKRVTQSLLKVASYLKPETWEYREETGIFRGTSIDKGDIYEPR
jgi:hypothetical protein